MTRDRAARPEAKSLRVFVAVEVPDEAKDAAAEAAAALRERYPKARWARPENQHVTLKFMGQTWPRLLGWVHGRVADVATNLEPFEVHLEGLGVFRSPASARVVWVGLRDHPAGALAGAAAALDAALVREFAAETRPFAAHLTLARSEPPLALDPADLVVWVPPITWRVEHLTLFRSHLQRPAPRYERLGDFPLAGSSALQG